MMEWLRNLKLTLAQWLSVAGAALLGFLLFLLRVKNREIQKLKVENLEEKIKSSDLSYEEQLKKAEEEREREEALYDHIIDPNP